MKIRHLFLNEPLFESELIFRSKSPCCTFHGTPRNFNEKSKKVICRYDSNYWCETLQKNVICNTYFWCFHRTFIWNKNTFHYILLFTEALRLAKNFFSQKRFLQLDNFVEMVIWKPEYIKKNFSHYFKVSSHALGIFRLFWPLKSKLFKWNLPIQSKSFHRQKISILLKMATYESMLLCYLIYDLYKYCSQRCLSKHILNCCYYFPLFSSLLKLFAEGWKQNHWFWWNHFSESIDNRVEYKIHKATKKDSTFPQHMFFSIGTDTYSIQKKFVERLKGYGKKTKPLPIIFYSSRKSLYGRSPNSIQQSNKYNVTFKRGWLLDVF